MGCGASTEASAAPQPSAANAKEGYATVKTVDSASEKQTHVVADGKAAQAPGKEARVVSKAAEEDVPVTAEKSEAEAAKDTGREAAVAEESAPEPPSNPATSPEVDDAPESKPGSGDNAEPAAEPSREVLQEGYSPADEEEPKQEPSNAGVGAAVTQDDAGGLKGGFSAKASGLSQDTGSYGKLVDVEEAYDGPAPPSKKGLMEAPPSKKGSFEAAPAGKEDSFGAPVSDPPSKKGSFADSPSKKGSFEAPHSKKDSFEALLDGPPSTKGSFEAPPSKEASAVGVKPPSRKTSATSAAGADAAMDDDAMELPVVECSAVKSKASDAFD